MTEARAWLARGLEAHRAGRHDIAEQAYRQAIELADDGDAWHMLGMLRHQSGDPAAALSCLDHALQRRPADPAVLANRAAVQLALQAPARAEHDAAEAARLRPDHYPAWFNLGLALEALQRHQAAADALQVADQLRPAAAARDALLRVVFAQARLLSLGGQPSAAERAWSRYFAIGGDAADAWLLQGNVLADLGRHAASLASYRQAARRAPGDPDPASAELIAACYQEDSDAEAQGRLARAWAARFCNAIEPARMSVARVQPGRIGFYSPRFSMGPMASLVLPLLRELRLRGIAVYLYSGFDHVDAMTPAFRNAASVWRDCAGAPDAGLVHQARSDSLDVMVDLCGHAPGNRLRAFAERMAPLQLSWGDWFATTGVPAMDAFLGDAVLIPPDEVSAYTERVIRLPRTRFVYAAVSAVAPFDVARDPSVPLRLASFNRLSKLGDATLACWSAVLRRLPSATLLLKAAALDEVETVAEVRRRFSDRGIDGARLECEGFGSGDDAMARYRDVDIALDPFPFNGCVTTLDALWMGVPVIALRGRSLVGRQSASLLAAHGCADWIAEDMPGYVERVVALADSGTRQKARQHLARARRESPLFDAAQFCTDWLAALEIAAQRGG